MMSSNANISLHSGYFHETLRAWQSSGTVVNSNALIYPLFISSKDSDREEVLTLPGQYRIGIHHLVSHVDPLISIGLKTVLLFGVMDDELKDSNASKSTSVEKNKAF